MFGGTAPTQNETIGVLADWYHEMGEGCCTRINQDNVLCKLERFRQHLRLCFHQQNT